MLIDVNADGGVGHWRSTGSHRCSETGASGAFSGLNRCRSPNDEIFKQRLPINQARISISWQHLARIIGLEIWLLRQLPRVKL